MNEAIETVKNMVESGLFNQARMDVGRQGQEAVAGTSMLEIRHDLFEDRQPLDRRREHALDVLHYEHCGAQLIQYTTIFAIKEVTLVVLRSVVPDARVT